jgi:hypothetical protein
MSSPLGGLQGRSLQKGGFLPAGFSWVLSLQDFISTKSLVPRPGKPAKICKKACRTCKGCWVSQLSLDQAEALD